MNPSSTSRPPSEEHDTVDALRKHHLRHDPPSMPLPSPAITFRVPSIHDGRLLDCRIYLPDVLKRVDLVPAWSGRGAIVAHPYTALGGSYDDAVVSLMADELLQAGCVVGTFNFRFVSFSFLCS